MGHAMFKFRVNEEDRTFEGSSDTPLLWVLRDEFQLTGTKFGCGVGQCGACTVHINGEAVRACVVPISGLEGAVVKTIEGLSQTGDHPVQQAWLEEDVPQCGYCQAGQIMAVSEFLENFPAPTDEQIDSNLTNLCRCGTYVRIRKAVHRAAAIRQEMES